nr:hypothetical protein Iba_chr11dCG8230 [Ipomoea batatas]
MYCLIPDAIDVAGDSCGLVLPPVLFMHIQKIVSIFSGHDRRIPDRDNNASLAGRPCATGTSNLNITIPQIEPTHETIEPLGNRRHRLQSGQRSNTWWASELVREVHIPRGEIEKPGVQSRIKRLRFTNPCRKIFSRDRENIRGLVNLQDTISHFHDRNRSSRLIKLIAIELQARKPALSWPVIPGERVTDAGYVSATEGICAAIEPISMAA